MCDRSIQALEEIIERHTAANKARHLVQEILRAGSRPDDIWQKIYDMAKELSEALNRNQTREYEPWF